MTCGSTVCKVHSLACCTTDTNAAAGSEAEASVTFHKLTGLCEDFARISWDRMTKIIVIISFVQEPAQNQQRHISFSGIPFVLLNTQRTHEKSLSDSC